LAENIILTFFLEKLKKSFFLKIREAEGTLDPLNVMGGARGMAFERTG
jgi:hypothetical protein